MGSILKNDGQDHPELFFGRYLALLLIVALSVSFFAGLKVTKRMPCMLRRRTTWTPRIFATFA